MSDAEWNANHWEEKYDEAKEELSELEDRIDELETSLEELNKTDAEKIGETHLNDPEE